MTKFFLSVSLAACISLSVASNCQGDQKYDQGAQQAVVQWEASYKYAGCEGIENNYEIVGNAAPKSPPCLREGFLDELDMLYDSAAEVCGGGSVDCSLGRTEANHNWDNNLDTYEDECSTLDKVFEESNKDSPGKNDCFKDEYDERTQQLYEIGLKNCVNECRGWGYQQGDSLASTFCAVAALYSDDQSLVEQICKGEEIEKCKERFREAVEEDCPEKLVEQNYEFYDDLEESCEIAIGPDQPMPTTKPYPGDPDYQMTCKEWYDESKNNNCKDSNGKTLEKKTGCCKYNYRCGGWPKCTEINCCTRRD
ncbi:hypothetical protein SARC_09670 [Sphaeroforma arctica JP610]|uniref:Uncharacterized protein n=1 Tax=Sphaeroforma arctica JP610 TaxID=667725 RepID=A0A0L0FM67_9EUKA|nr:hypothetical protein SARC_09670 [Sphaeroforma arctica JP610]KNC77879.1 hypothetical protein SARC_09670 [Sphaeroforma arctica JP610]|eukprot:XP_014151781.1 hypothetical protein SARC_09670 [Sphaeroforma arctica JP610]